MSNDNQKIGYMGQSMYEFYDEGGHEICDVFYEGPCEESLRKIKFYLGELIIYFNELESNIDKKLCETFVSDADEPGMLFVHGLWYKQKIDRLILYYKRFFTLSDRVDEIGLIEDLGKRLNKIGEIRNMCIHGKWKEMNRDGFVRVKTSFGKIGVNAKFKKITSDDLDDYIGEIQQLVLDLDELSG